MYDPWSVMGVDDLKHPTYVMAFMAIEVEAGAASATGVADESWKIEVKTRTAAEAVRNVDDIVMCGCVGEVGESKGESCEMKCKAGYQKTVCDLCQWLHSLDTIDLEE